MPSRSFLTLLGLTLGALARADDEAAPAESRRVVAGRFDTAPILDGRLDDPVWQTAGRIEGLTQVVPVEGGQPSERTVVLVGYDSQNLYFGIACHDRDPSGIVATQMLRDSSLGFDDRIVLVLDTFRDRRSGFYFEVGAAGGRRDALIDENGNSFNDDWDTVWEAEVSRTNEGWFVEVKIPTRSLPFDPDATTWGFNVSRRIRRRNEEVRWTAAQNIFSVTTISQAGELAGIRDLQRSVGVDVKPYAKGSYFNDRRNSRRNLLGDVGGDAIWRVTPSLTFNLTLNTDFAETEVDSRQVNLTRFPLFFPEKREFFLEDAEIFNFGDLGRRYVPFFSRRVGLSSAGEEVPILGGAKLSGRVGGTRLGVLDVQIDDEGGLPSRNLLAARVLQNVFEESTAGLLLTRGNPNDSGGNTLVGTDFNYRTTSFLGDRNLNASAFVTKSYTSGPGGDGVAWGASLDYPNDIWQARLSMRHFGSDINPGLGFIRRTGIRQYFATAAYRPRPGNFIRQMNFEVTPSVTTSTGNDRDMWSVEINPLEFELESGDSFEFDFERMFETFTEDFNIVDGVVVPGDDYEVTRYEVEVASAAKRPAQVFLQYEWGDFLSGRRTDYTADLSWRPCRFYSTALTWEINQVRLPEGDFTVRLARWRLDLSFTPGLTWNNFLQWDNQSQNVGLNSRLRFLQRDGQELFMVFNTAWLREGASYALEAQEAIVKIEYLMRF